MKRRYVVVRGDVDLAESLLVDVARVLEDGDGRGGTLRRQAGGHDLYLKVGRLRGKARARHALRHHALGLDYPRLAEFDNLAWLREHGFGAPRPLLAGVYHRHGIALGQFLATEAVPGVRTLSEVLADGRDEERRPALERLAAETARLHARGFVHRDLFPRNVLVCREDGGARILFVDAWRGGPRHGLRGPAYDLACLFLADDLIPEVQAGEFLARYASERGRAGRAADPGKLLRSVTRARRLLLLRVRRRPGRLDGPPPSPRWEPPLTG